jgi:hypothetical protein
MVNDWLISRRYAVDLLHFVVAKQVPVSRAQHRRRSAM